MTRPFLAAMVAMAAACSTSEGVFHATWSITRSADGAKLACADVGADTVAVLVNEVNTQSYREDDFSCSPMAATTPAFPYGAYYVSLTMLSNGTRVGTTDAVMLHMNADELDLPEAMFGF